MSEGDAGRAGQEISDRVHAVIAAAERAAEAIRADAEQQARAQLEEAQERADVATAERMQTISRLTDGLVAQAATIGRQAEQLLGALDAAIASVEAQLRAMPAPEPLPAPPTAEPDD